MKKIFLLLILLTLAGCTYGKTPEQIAELRLLEQQRFEQEQAEKDKEREYKLKLEEQKSEAVKAAEISAKAINNATDTAAGLYFINLLLR